MTSSALAIESIDIDKKLNPATLLGSQLEGSIELVDELGVHSTLRDIVSRSRSDGHSKPTILVPVYYDCPRMCGLTLNGVVDLVKKLPLELGKDYQLVSVSFDSSETPELAARRAQEYRGKLGLQNAADWKFFVGQEAQVNKLMEQIGFKFLKDASGEFAHGAMIVVLTNSGVISQFFTGIEFPDWDVKLSLVQASEGGVGTILDQVMLFCFHFDPYKGRYTWAAWNVARFGSLFFMLLFGAIVLFNIRKKA
jgi:protein SCO1/2